MTSTLQSTLRSSFGFEAFRPGQEEAIEHLLAGRHAVVVMPTGAGKSLVYQLSSLCVPTTTLVISPLISLMRDQVTALNKRGIHSTFINSTVPSDKQLQRTHNMEAGRYRLVYVAPERLRSVQFREALARTPIGLLAVDEAHCISHWGHDFRPDYLQIGPARQLMNNPTTVALTATATPDVQKDIARLLGLKPCKLVVTGFNRPNLSFEVRYAPDAEAKLRVIYDLFAESRDQAAIVYAGTRRDSEELAEFISATAKIDARYYHGGMAADLRSEVQDAFIDGSLQVAVATNAFGMGIDRPDVRMVIHHSIPGTLEAYYQEAGRAGRDGQPARAVLIYSPKDRALQEWFIENSTPTRDELSVVYGAALSSTASDGWIASEDISLKTGLHDVSVRIALAQLESAGIIDHLGDSGLRMLLRCNDWDDEALRTVDKAATERKKHRMKQLAEMVSYAESGRCRRQILLAHFGDQGPADSLSCCDNCLGRESEEATEDRETSTITSRSTSTTDEMDVAMTILDTIRLAKWDLGRSKLAQVLWGAKRADLRQFGHDVNPHYGKLSSFSQGMIRDLIDELVSKGYIRMIGGALPVLQLTPLGITALKDRRPISLNVPLPRPPKPVRPRPVSPGEPDTVSLTEEMLQQGMTPPQIAELRGLSPETILSHCAKLIAAERVELSDVIPADVDAQIRAAIAEVGSADRIAPIKLLLPESVTYGEIRCVAEAWKREHGIVDGPAVLKRIVQLGEERSSDSVPELIQALASLDGSARRLAASALGKIGDASAVEPLISLLERESLPQVRQPVVKALGRIGDPRAKPVLERIVSDADEASCIQISASEALHLILKAASRGFEAAPTAQPEQRQEPDEAPDPVTVFLSQAHPRPLVGPWSIGWALGFHSGFSGDQWSRSKVGQLAYQLKYQQDRSALKPLVDLITSLMAEHRELANADIIAPVPPSTAKEFDHVQALADALGGGLGIPVRPVITRLRPTEPQKEMRSLAQKKANVAGAFGVAENVADKRVLIVDDFYDSGATLEEIARVLRATGALGTAVLTLTRTIHSDS